MIFPVEPSDFLLLIRRRLALILILTSAGLAFSIYSTSKMTPMYSSTATIFVSTPPSISDPLQVSGNKLGDLATGNNFTQARVKSYATIINNVATLKPVVEELKLSGGPEALASRVSAVAPPNTVLMYVTAVDPNPVLASKIANSVANHFSETVLNIELNSISDKTKVIKLSVVQDAQPNFKPVSPRKNFNYLLGIFAGAMLALTIALILRYLDKSMKSEKDLGETQLLGVIAFDSLAIEKPLVPQLGAYSVRTEAFRIFRTNLLHMLDQVNSNCTALSSCFSGEGKTTATLNLGFTIAQAGFKVVIVEADMRRPGISKYLTGLIPNFQKNKFGLSNLLIEKNSLSMKRKIHSATTLISKTNLSLILSGETPDNPSELLEGERFNELIDILCSTYDYVLIDTPPVLAVADATIISRFTENIVLLVHAGSTSKRNFEAAREAIRGVGVTLNGAILNKVPKHKAGDHYGYTYSDPMNGYYRYSYDYKPEEPAQISKNPVKSAILRTFQNGRKRDSDTKLEPTRNVQSDNAVSYAELLKKFNLD